jgi:RNA polymerase sigma-70 factor (ECF subfamily)
MPAAPREHRFQTLVDAHRGILIRVSATYARDPDDREDLAQEIVVQLWRSFPRFDERLKFSTWMYRVALNVAISYHRRERTRARYVIADDARLLEAVDPRAAPRPELVALGRALAELPPLDRALVLLHLDGCGHREIGEVLGITASNVGTRLDRVRRRLRERLGAGEHEPKGA